MQGLNHDFSIPTLGSCLNDSPLLTFRDSREETLHFVEESDRILVDHEYVQVMETLGAGNYLPSLERAGPRRKIYFHPHEVRIGIVTCGGLCPGLNNVIRSLVMSANYHYGVKEIIGFRYGYRGFISKDGHMDLTPDLVSDIHLHGGSFLASSRGQQDTAVMVNRLVELGISILFVIGGDGTMRGALDLADEIRRRELKIAIIGIPKTIDNDFRFMDQSFGFITAFSKALESIEGAHREAQCAPNGIGLVKLMGRQSGFIACSATLASGNVNFILIPEVPFKLDGPKGFLECLRKRLEKRGHALIVVAEGAGQDLMADTGPEKKDASGNVKLKDIGIFLSERIKEYFKTNQMEVNLKYIDPSYIIRSLPATAVDSVFCAGLGMHAVHAGMCGKTEMTVGLWHHTLVHVPIRQAISQRNVVDTTGPLWLSVLGATGQPLSFG